MKPGDLTQLNGQSVLVKSTADRHDPPTALRGTIEARPSPRGRTVVKIVLEYPDMFNAAAHRGVIALDAAGIDRLVASQHDGVYEYTVDGPLDPGPEPATPQDSE